MAGLDVGGERRVCNQRSVLGDGLVQEAFAQYWCQETQQA